MSSSQQQPSEQDLKDAHKLLFDSGLRTRYAVAGKEYVDKSLANGSSEFSRPMQGETSHPSFPLSFSIQFKPTQPITNPSTPRVRHRILLALHLGPPGSREKDSLPPQYSHALRFEQKYGISGAC